MKTENFIQILESGLRIFTQKDTLEKLGDRSEYVGSSDVGKCLFQTVMSKTNPVEHSLKQMIIFERGHIAEDIIKNALIGAGINFENQKLAVGEGDLSFCKTHIDFYLPEQDCIIEVKTTRSLNENIWYSWNQQVQFQMGLSKVKKALIIAMDINTGEIALNELSFNEIAFKLAIDDAKKIMEAVKFNNPVEPTKGLLCSVCSYKSQCPAILEGSCEVDEDADRTIQNYIELEQNHKIISKEMKILKETLQDFLKACEMKKVTTQSGATLELTTRKGYKRLDTKLLEEHLGKEELEKFYVTGEPSTSLKVY